MNLINKPFAMSALAISVALSLTGCDSSSDPIKEVVAPVAVEITNGSFEADLAGVTTPEGTWELRTTQGDGAVSTIEVIESTEGADSYKGTKAVKVMIDQLGNTTWDVEVAYENIPVTGGKTYEFSVWVKGEADTHVDFYIQTPEYGQRDLINETLTGEWQEIKLTAKADALDTLLRLAAHFSKEGNAGKSFYLDEFSGVISDVPDVEIPEVEYSAVDVKSLKALTTELNIGVAVPAGGAGNSILKSEERQAVIEQHFNQLSAENIMKPEALHPVQGMPFYDDADALVAYAKENSMTVHGHVFVWHGQIPNWMRTFQGDKAAWITMMEDHIKLVATHFEEEGDNDTVTSWDVVNEAFNENGSYRGSKKATNPDPNDNSVWYENIGEEFLPLAFKAARAADPDADLYYNDYNLIHNEEKLDAVIAMVNTFDEGTINGIGFQSHISVGDPSIATIKAQLEKVMSQTKLKVKITELDVRMNNVPDSDTPLTYLTSERADEQKQYYHDIVKTYLEVVPAERRGGITVWGAIDGDSWLQSWPRPTTEWPLLFNSDYTAKPALQGFADALSAESEIIPPVVVVPDVANADFEAGLGSWGPRGDATVTLNTTQSHTGSNSALVAGRTATWQGISKSVVGLFKADQTYNVSAWVKLSDDASTVTPDMKLTLEIKYGVDTTEYLEMAAPVTVAAGDWVELTGTYVHKIASTANEANLYVEGSDIAVDFYVDDISVKVAE